ncbi:MAG: SRPBCC domain-containing protein [Planctomycetota bacterium]
MKSILAASLLASCALALGSCSSTPETQSVATERTGIESLEYTVIIDAPVEKVWATMWDPASYTEWTSPFMEGSYFEGDWSEGSRMHFLAPGGSGMVAVVAENRPHEYLSLKNIGFVTNGVEDTTSEAVLSWAPTYENYRFVEASGGTQVFVEQEIPKGYEEFMNSTWAQVMPLLKSLCETE